MKKIICFCLLITGSTAYAFSPKLSLPNPFAKNSILKTKPAAKPTALKPQLINTSSVIKNAMPTVVNIVNQGELDLIKNPFLRHQLLNKGMMALLKKRHFIGMGSGVIIDAKKGLIVTNAHVVDLDKKITVTLNDGRRYEAKKLGADNKTDIALIQIKADNLKELSLGDSSTLDVGDKVFAIGSPFGLNQTLTAGIVSALHRSELGIEGYENFIQTDAPTNMGSSGGALINEKGILVGINTALLSPTGGNIGIGFAIPANMVKSIVDQILRHGNIKHGVIGVMVQNLTPDLAAAFGSPVQKGALVSQVMGGTPAQQSGIQTGDIITAINDEPIQSNDDVHNTVGLLRVGDSVPVKLFRKGDPITLTVSVTDPKQLEKISDKLKKPFLYGVQLQNIVEQSPGSGYHHGILVSDVDEYSDAFVAGLQPGDVILEANHQPVKNIEALNKTAQQNEQTLLLKILRGKSVSFIVIH